MVDKLSFLTKPTKNYPIFFYHCSHLLQFFSSTLQYNISYSLIRTRAYLGQEMLYCRMMVNILARHRLETLPIFHETYY